MIRYIHQTAIGDLNQGSVKGYLHIGLHIYKGDAPTGPYSIAQKHDIQNPHHFKKHGAIDSYRYIP